MSTHHNGVAAQQACRSAGANGAARIHPAASKTRNGDLADEKRATGCQIAHGKSTQQTCHHADTAALGALSCWQQIHCRDPTCSLADTLAVECQLKQGMPTAVQNHGIQHPRKTHRNADDTEWVCWSKGGLAAAAPLLLIRG